MGAVEKRSRQTSRVRGVDNETGDALLLSLSLTLTSDARDRRGDLARAGAGSRESAACLGDGEDSLRDVTVVWVASVVILLTLRTS